ncbi:MAG: hypothetical protein RIS92_2725 [Verrucomicrobiota bacterium]
MTHGGVPDDFRFADFEKFWLGGRGGAGAGAAWVADGDGAGIVVVHRPQHVNELGFVLGGAEDEVGHVAEVADVEEAVVGRAVVSGEAAAVHADGDVQVLQGDVVHDHVVRALHEGGVD